MKLSWRSNLFKARNYVSRTGVVSKITKETIHVKKKKRGGKLEYDQLYIVTAIIYGYIIPILIINQTE